MVLITCSFSRQALDGNKAAKGKCLAEKQEIKKCLSSGIEGRHFLTKSVLKGLKFWHHLLY